MNKQMKKAGLLCLCSFMFVLGGCRSAKKTQVIEEPPEAIQALEELRSRIQASDEEIVLAVERMAKVEKAWGKAMEEGLITAEDIDRMYAEMPFIMEKTKQAIADHKADDALTASLAAAVLKAYQDDTVAQLLPSLRNVISRYYKSIVKKPNEIEAHFIEKANKLAERDKELEALLQRK